MKSFIICLSKIPSSYDGALSLKNQIEKFNLFPEIFEGTYGNEAVSLIEKEKRTFSSEAFSYEPDPLRWEHKSSRPGVLGCFYSHYRLWQKCVDLNEPIIIFEDDVIFYRPFVPVDWDEILILSLCTEWTDRSEKYFHLLEENNEEPKALEFLDFCVPGTSGYAIKPKAAKKLLKLYKNTFAPSDHAINKNVVKIQIHNKLIGRSRTEDEGKESLTRNFKMWRKFNHD
jgi:glycosyl transferase family 25